MTTTATPTNDVTAANDTHAGYDPVLGMCTATSPSPHRHAFCQLPFGHQQPEHDWGPEYRQPCASCGTVLVAPPRLECAGCRAEGWVR